MVAAAMLEVEAKVRVRDLAEVRDRLRSAQARRVGVEEQEDAFFAHPARDFARTDEALRLRRAEGRLELTYKGPRLDGGVAKARREETLELGKDPTPMLEALGFRLVARLRKRRETHAMGGVTVALDRLSGLGDFVEVEAVATAAKAAERKVEKAMAILGLQGEPRLRESYLELALAAGAAAATRV